MAETKEQLLAKIAQAVAAQLPRDADIGCKSIKLNDAVWGTVTLLPHEVALLNTPLMQRLRLLRQLGSSHLVFPGAHHTRFEHTLGVLHLTSKICAQLRESHPDAIDERAQNNLRMAALCHDIGHGPFSHSSERFFARVGAMKKMLDGNGGNAAEQLSAHAVMSEPLSGFFNQLNSAYEVELDARFIADAIVGTLPPKQAYLGEVIHGPLDTDKLDYLVRDSLFCGINVRIDFERILSCLDIADYGGKRRLIGKRSAAAALMQLVQHKHYLFAVVYQHPVSRSFAAMVEIALSCAHADKTKMAGKAITSAADFLCLDDNLLLAPGSVEASPAADLLNDMRNRNLFKPALKIEGYLLDENARKRLEDGKDELETAIALAAKVPKHLVCIDINARQSNTEASNMVIRQGSQLVLLGNVLELRDERIPLHKFLERHLVLCPAKHRDAVKKAATKVLADVLPASIGAGKPAA